MTMEDKRSEIFHEEPPIGPIAVEEAEDKYTAGYEQWLVDGDKFIPITETESALPAGDYNIRYDRSYDKNVLVKRQPLTEKLLHLPMKEFDEVLADIRVFWNSRAEYDEFGYIYKRGVLLYGPPGCGKTSLVSLMTKDLISKQGGVVINITNSDDVFAFDEIMKAIREIEPDRRVIAVIEDIDNFFNNDKHTELMSKLLNILDGKMQFDNIVIIATTNYPEDLEENVSNRPTRFAMRREIGPPKMRAREFYLRAKLKKKHLKGINIDAWLAETKGFTIDHLKELVCLVFVHKRGFEEALAEVRSMIKKPVLHNTTQSEKNGMGFKFSASDFDDDRQ